MYCSSQALQKTNSVSDAEHHDSSLIVSCSQGAFQTCMLELVRQIFIKRIPNLSNEQIARVKGGGGGGGGGYPI